MTKEILTVIKTEASTKLNKTEGWNTQTKSLGKIGSARILNFIALATINRTPPNKINIVVNKYLLKIIYRKINR